jgi:glycosyltransferase involved in cell wall biosynthesis
MCSIAIAMAKAKIFKPKSKTIVWVQDIYTLGLKETQGHQGFGTKFVGSVEKWLLQSADSVVVIHQRFQDAVIREFSLNPEKVTVIRNWGQFSFKPTEEVIVTRNRLGWNPDDLVVLHAGNMGVKQGLAPLIEVSKFLQKRRPEIKIVLLGDGNQRTSLMNLAEGLNNVLFIDPVDEGELSNMLQAADIALVHEQAGVSDMAVPSKLTTYFSAAKPVLAVTEEKSITAEEIINSGAGISIEAGNPEIFLEAIDSLLDAKKIFSNSAAQFASAKLSGDSAVVAFESLIDKLSKSRGKS